MRPHAQVALIYVGPSIVANILTNMDGEKLVNSKFFYIKTECYYCVGVPLTSIIALGTKLVNA